MRVSQSVAELAVTALAGITVVAILVLWGLSSSPFGTQEARPKGFCAQLSDDSWFAVTNSFCRMEERQIQLINDEDKLVTIRARIADEPFEHLDGYQFVGPGVKLPAQRAGLLKVNGNGSRVTKAEPESTS
jgi:hypothetical protein